ncbi:transport SEC61 gamma subunit [Raphidocelis subcapitata]|uniref:Transport SEC61 gamma subunit n=1 Tax=Raphidocelis subcapitata TaxID=307507 RepID=A0A2V0P2W4_9CHLO|nr:transport SEC61 gamma subunit [Raphidocelis subcapitata]|eukprot:GBF92190.1 transport SEC61 gamma subunit [Raphidocelis subcapitata]
MEAPEGALKAAKDFAKGSYRLVKRCSKPDRKEFKKVSGITAMGFIAAGFIGFFIKLVFIPINQIIVGG